MAFNDRHVHFAAENDHYIYPTTPSPSYSQSSLPSSPGLMTPPPIHAMPAPPTPYPFQPRPLPSLSPETTALYAPQPMPIVIHPALDRPSAIGFDLRIDPFPTKVVRDLAPTELAKPATSPPLPQLRLKCKLLPWIIVVRPSSPKPNAFVTVSDVLAGTYTQLCEAVKQGEFGRVRGVDEMNAIRDAWQKRCHEVRGAVDVERRIDFLMNNTMFKGLSATEEAPDVLRLSVSPPS
ncbi:hypothetical protein EYR40_006334 [Pleurotus pulmonarius]|nr:hypothetical protein EYR36_010955 [Pleurotus pulmonarius]KAF4599243.1 hypothetical protein EYR40_006334 [Pleurotus pulmonarius]